MKHLVSRKNPVTKPRPLAEKAILKSPQKSAQTGGKKSEVVSSKKIETKPVEKKTARNSVQTAAPKIEKTVSAQPLKKIKTNVAATPKSKVKNAQTEKAATVEAAAKKKQPTVSERNTKNKTVKVKVVAPAKTAKSENQKSKLVAVSKQKSKLAPTTKKAENAAAKKTPSVLKNPAKAQSKKLELVIAAKKTAIKDAKSNSVTPAVGLQPSIKKVKAAVAVTNSDVKTLGEISKLKTVETIKKVKLIENETKPKNLPAAQTVRKTTTKPLISVEEDKVSAKIKKQVIAPAAHVENPKVVEGKIEEIQPARSVKPKNKKAKPISSAVFRGKKDRYDFKVFALSEIFEPIPAVYIISKRVTDKRKKGHHALICIGATDSISDELKKHRKGKCVKKHAANVISILPEADEKIRLKIETDLKAAHSVVCSFE